MNFRFLVDVNLPKNFSFFNDPKFVHIADIDPSMSDNDVWQYAINHQYVILTKDTDFYMKFVTEKNKPRVIFFQTGNTSLKELHEYFEQHWENILRLLEEYRFIVATKEKLHTIR